MNSPKMRFNEYNDSYNSFLFGEIVTHKSEKYNPSLHNEKYKCIELEHLSSNTGQLLGYTDSSTQASIKNVFQNGSVLYGKLRPYLNKYYFPQFDGVCSSEIWVLNSTTQNLINHYLFYLVQTNRYSKTVSKAIGSKMPRADWQSLSESEFFIPKIEEQNKIASFLKKIDYKIQLQKEKIDLLKEQERGYRHRIFNKEIRFNDENGKDYSPWKTVKLHTLVDQIKGNSLKNKEKVNLPILTISAKSGFVNQEDRFSAVIAGNSLAKYTELDKYDISYNKGNSKTAKFGCVFVQSKYHKALVPNVYKSFRAKENVNPFYLQYLFASKLLDRQLKGIISSTARMDGLLNVSDEDFYNINILCPSVDEQNIIVYFLLLFEQKIEFEEKKLEVLLNQKQGFMQQMFI